MSTLGKNRKGSFQEKAMKPPGGETPLNDSPKLPDESSHQKFLPESQGKVVIKGGDLSHAKFGDETVMNTVVKHYHQATDATFELPPGHFSLNQPIIIVSENDPISLESRIYRAKLQSELLGPKDIVVKILPNGERQRREAQIHFALPHHENIVERITADTFSYRAQSSIYIAMELCHQLNLYAFVKSQLKDKVPFDPVRFMSYARQIASALEFIHRHGITHRDLKPSNILMSLDLNNIKMADFGFSKVIDCDRGFATQSSIQPGTDGWRSPELLKGFAEITPSTDIFSFGLVFYYLWSYGKHPFGEDPHSWNHYIKRGENMNLGDLLIPDPDKARSLLRSMLKQNPEERPSAQEVLNHKELSSKKNSSKEKTFEEAEASVRSVGVQVPEKEGIAIFDKKSKNLMIFDPSANTWSKMQQIPHDIIEAYFSAVSLNNYIYVMKRDKSVYRLEFSNKEAKWERMADMMFYHVVKPRCAVASGFIYAAGTSCLGGETRSTEKYDPASNQWIALPDQNTSAVGNTLASLQGFIYSIGGRKKGILVNKVERFNAFTSKWTFIADMHSSRGWPAAVEFDEKLFVLGGYDGHQHLSTVEYYDPMTDTWTKLRYMKEPRFIFRAFAIDGKIYAVGEDGRSETIEKYDVERDEWEKISHGKESEIRILDSVKVKLGC